MSKTNIVIVGSGFAGIACYQQLKGLKNTRVALVSDSDTFEYSPSIHEAIVEKTRDPQICLSVKEIVGENFIQAKATSIKDKQLILENGLAVDFDYLVIASGSRANFFGNDSYANHTFPLKKLKHAQKIRKALSKAKTITVIGGGYTGVEAASILVENTNKQVNIVHSRDLLLHVMDPAVGKLAMGWFHQKGANLIMGSRTKKVTKSDVELENGEKIKSDLVIYTAGVCPNCEFLGQEYQVKPTLQVKGRSDIYACGDIVTDQYLPTAHNAIISGRFVASQIKRKINKSGPQQKFKRDWRILAVALGSKDGILTFGSKGIFIPAIIGFMKRIIEKSVIITFRYNLPTPF